MYVVHLAKENFKFSCSHFTILGPDRGERLHGHNYQMSLDLTVSDVDAELGMTFDFNTVKPVVRRICEELDERILLPTKSPFLILDIQKQQTHVQFGRKTYSFPNEDTLTLPIVNISAEQLAWYIGGRLSRDLQSLPNWRHLTVNVEETRGQSVSFSCPRPS